MRIKALLSACCCLSIALSASMSIGMGMDMSPSFTMAEVDHSCCPGGEAPDSDTAPSCCLYAPGASVGSLVIEKPRARTVSLAAVDRLVVSERALRAESIPDPPNAASKFGRSFPRAPRAPPAV